MTSRHKEFLLTVALTIWAGVIFVLYFSQFAALASDILSNLIRSL